VLVLPELLLLELPDVPVDAWAPSSPVQALRIATATNATPRKQRDDIERMVYLVGFSRSVACTAGRSATHVTLALAIRRRL
jgi:hypothetical protein